jgi:hypothetical protein
MLELRTLQKLKSLTTTAELTVQKNAAREETRAFVFATKSLPYPLPLQKNQFCWIN